MHLFTYETLDSTNLEAVRLWVARGRRTPVPPEPFAVVAREQTAGMGRSGRSWQSPRGGLWMSVAWPLTRTVEHYQALPLAAGAAVAAALEAACGVACQVKWPNDLLVNGRKLAGILCQAELLEPWPMAVIGVGINGNYQARQITGQLKHPATSLHDTRGRETDLDMLAHTVAGEIATHLRAYDDMGLDAALATVRSRLAWAGQHVECTDAAGALIARGTLKGIDRTGQLLLDCAGAQRTLAIGEIRLQRPTHVRDATMSERF